VGREPQQRKHHEALEGNKATEQESVARQVFRLIHVPVLVNKERVLGRPEGCVPQKRAVQEETDREEEPETSPGYSPQ
jgi:hypothetical protein